MTEVTLHPTPRLRDVVLEQVKIVGLSLRLAALIVAVILGIGTLLVGGDLLFGGPGFDSYERFPTAVIAFLFPFAVWRNEKRFGPAFLWTLPVERRQLALTRVFAGWVWLMVAVAVFDSWLLALGLFAHASLAHTIMRVPLVTTITAYLLGSALVLGLRYPLRWLLGTAGGLLILTRATDLLGRSENGEWQIVGGDGLTRPAFFSALEHAAAVAETLPAVAQWAITAFFGFGIGLTALWAAASRHGERRRR